MSENVNSSKRKLFVGEIVWLSIFGAIWIVGFVFAILGVCAYNVGKLSTNSLYSLQKSFASFFGMDGVMDFRIVGTAAMILAMIGLLIVIFYYTNKAVQEENKKRRYEERMRILMESDEQK